MHVGGGEEFIIMLHNTPAQDGVPVAERIRSAIENNKFLIEGHEIRITASFGISELLYLDTDWLNTAYKKADKALYIAKNNGRNQCVIEADQNYQFFRSASRLTSQIPTLTQASETRIRRLRKASPRKIPDSITPKTGIIKP